MGPDGQLQRAPTTFKAKDDAIAWLSRERRLIDHEDWMPTAERSRTLSQRGQTFETFAADWLANRQIRGQPLKPRTREHYQSLLDRFILPTFGAKALSNITAEQVTTWYQGLSPHTPTYRAHAYGLLRTILGAVDPSVLASNPARIRGAGTTTRRHHVEPLSVTELDELVQAMPEKRRLLILLAAWCALRFGEMAELRRRDIDVTNGLVKIRRGAVRASGRVLIGTPKSEAGARDVAIPPHLMPAVKDHLARFADSGRDGLVFPGRDSANLAPSTFYGRAPRAARDNETGEKVLRGGHGFYRARVVAGHPNLRLHDLRHTGSVLAAQAGATLPELMQRLGHSTPAAAMRYQHAAAGRDKVIAAALSQMAQGAS